MALTESQKQIIADMKAIGFNDIDSVKYSDLEEPKAVEETKNVFEGYEKPKLFLDIPMEEPFIVTQNDIVDLDIYFKVRSKNTMHRESIAHLVFNSASNAEPIFALGKKTMIAVQNGVEILVGKLVINALSHQTPLMNLCNLCGVNSIYDLPPLDMVITPKNIKEKYLRDKSSSVVFGIKFKDWLIDEGVESPGKYFVITCFASSIKNMNYNETKGLIANVINPFEYNFKESEIEVYKADINNHKKAFDDSSALSNLIGNANTSKQDLIRVMPYIYERIINNIFVSYDQISIGPKKGGDI